LAKEPLASAMKGLEGKTMDDKRQERRFSFENCALQDIKATYAQEAVVAKPVRNMARVKKAVDYAPLKIARVMERGREKPQQRQTV
jgi:hypothetical protein